MSRITSPIIRHVLLDERRLSYPVSGRHAVHPGVEEREHLAADYLGHAPVGRFSQGFSTRFWFRVFFKETAPLHHLNDEAGRRYSSVLK